MQLSDHFSLDEFLISPTAKTEGFTEQFSPSSDIVVNLIQTAHMMEEIRHLVSLKAGVDTPIRISSGYRCERLNSFLSGSHNSQHLTGEASDSVVDGWSVRDYYLLIKNSNIVFDELIIEHDSAGHLWVHVSRSVSGNNRGLCFYGELIHGVGTIVHPDGLGAFKNQG